MKTHPLMFSTLGSLLGALRVPAVSQFRLGAFFALALVLIGLLPETGSAQQLYVVRGSRGSVTYTTTPPDAGARYEVFKPREVTFSTYKGFKKFRSWRPGPVKSDYDTLIVEKAGDHSLEPALVKAVVHVESYFNAKARSSKGAMGLMQLMPGTAKRFGVKNAYTPAENIGGGVQYLKLLLERYDGDERLALAAYNAGEGAVDSYGRIPPYTETQDYVRRVLQVRELYRCVESGKKRCAS